MKTQKGLNSCFWHRLNYGLEQRRAGVVASYSKQILAIPIWIFDVLVCMFACSFVVLPSHITTGWNNLCSFFYFFDGFLTRHLFNFISGSLTKPPNSYSVHLWILIWNFPFKFEFNSLCILATSTRLAARWSQEQ